MLSESYLLDIKKKYIGNHILGLSEVNSGEFGIHCELFVNI